MALLSLNMNKSTIIIVVIITIITIVIVITVIIISPPTYTHTRTQTLWDEMRGMPSRDLSQRPSAQGAEQGVPPQLLHVHGLQQTAVHGRGALRHRRKQVRVQRRLSELRNDQGSQLEFR